MNKVFEAKNIYNNPMKINIERTSQMKSIKIKRYPSLF